MDPESVLVLRSVHASTAVPFSLTEAVPEELGQLIPNT